MDTALNDSKTTHEWLVVLLPDGTVEAVDGGAPVTWVGHAITEVPDLDEAVREQASVLL